MPTLLRLLVLRSAAGAAGPNVPPLADFAYTVAGLRVTLLDASSDPDGRVVGWAWNFGDGTTSTAESPVHTYAAPGTYPVTLVVTDNRGDPSTPVTQNVTVARPPIQYLTLEAVAMIPVLTLETVTLEPTR